MYLIIDKILVSNHNNNNNDNIKINRTPVLYYNTRIRCTVLNSVINFLLVLFLWKKKTLNIHFVNEFVYN